MTLPKTELPLDDGPDARPKIAAGRDGKLIVTFATRDDKYNGHAFIARSEDGGKSFSAPTPITTNSPSQRFETATIDEDGRAFLAWIDKRDAAAAKAANKPYAGAALAYAWEDGAGGSLPDARIAQDNTCECCRIAVSFAGPGKPAILFRNIFDRRRPRPRGDHLRRSLDAGNAPSRFRRRRGARCLSASGAKPLDRPRRHLPCDLARPRQQAQRALLRALDSMAARHSRRRCRSATPRAKIHVPMSWPSRMRSRSPTRRSMANGRPSRS